MFYGELGHFLLILIDFLNIYMIFLYLLKKLKKKLSHQIISINFLIVTNIFLFLTYSYIISDFHLLNVFENSHTTQPLLYKICGVWGNHEGSMLLWCWFLTLYLYIFSFKFHLLNNEIILFTSIFQVIIINFFLNFLFFTSNPFLNILFFTLDGSELNPILQDPVLAIHPPLIYLGYLALSLVFCLALNYLHLKKYHKLFCFYIKEYTLISWFFLTAGIFLGSWWAYYELGWGGWWFWDPVENASLIPWILGTALLHSVTVSLKQNKLRYWTICLSILAFLFSLAGTFFVRSGLLTSVHSFAQDSTRGIFILFFILFLICFTLILTFKNINSTYSAQNLQDNKNINLSSKEFLIILNNFFLIIISLIIFCGTIAPFIFELIFEREISIGSSFYNSLIIPLAIPFLFLMTLSSIFSWRKTQIKTIINSYSYFFSFFIIILLFCSSSKTFSYYNTVEFLFQNSLFLLFFFLIIYSLAFFIHHLFFSNGYRKNNLYIYSHFGFTLFVLGAAISSNFNTEYALILNCGDFIYFNDFIFLFKNINLLEAPNYQSIFCNLLVLDHLDDFITTFTTFPEKKFYPVQGIFTTKAAVLTNFFHDLYIVLGDGNFIDGWYFRFKEEPGIGLIWLGGFIMFLSGCFAYYIDNIKFVGIPSIKNRYYKLNQL